MNETNSPIQRPLGPLMIDIAGLGLSELERQRLCHPLVGGLILFSRNYQSPEQLEQLTSEVHALREPALPIAIDHEGGRCSGAPSSGQARAVKGRADMVGGRRWRRTR